MVPPQRSLLSSGQRLSLFSEQFEGWQSYIVAFDSPLRRGETATIELQSEFSEISDDTRHWVSKTVTEPIEDEIILRILPQMHAVGESTAKVMQPGVGNYAESLLQVDIDKVTGERCVIVRQPRVGRRYYLDVELVFPEDLPDPQTVVGHWRSS